MGMKDTLINMSMLMIFVIAFIGFAVSFANENTTTLSVEDDSQFLQYKTDISSEAITYTTSANGSLEALQDMTIAAGDENNEQGGFFKDSPKSPVASTKKVFSLITYSLFGNLAVFGSIIAIITTTMLLIVGLYAWKVWKSGIPE